MIREDVFIDEYQTVKTDYETERNKPMPNRLHGTIQTEISFMLKSNYGDQYDFPSEVTLNTVPGTTPDVCIYPIKKLERRDIQAKETEMPITTIEILSPSQSVEYLADKAWEIYFPKGVKSAWIVVPAFKAVHVLLPDGQNLYFSTGNLKDPATGIEISIEKIFERMA